MRIKWDNTQKLFRIVSWQYSWLLYLITHSDHQRMRILQTILAPSHPDPETRLLRILVKLLVQVCCVPQVCWGRKKIENYSGRYTFSPARVVSWGRSRGMYGGWTVWKTPLLKLTQQCDCRRQYAFAAVYNRVVEQKCIWNLALLLGSHVTLVRFHKLFALTFTFTWR